MKRERRMRLHSKQQGGVIELYLSDEKTGVREWSITVALTLDGIEGAYLLAREKGY